MDFKKGLIKKVSQSVSSNDTAKFVGSGDLEVYATPMMIALMEQAASTCVKDYINEDESTVGIKIDISHKSATPVGMKVYATAELIDIDGKKLIFKVEAFDEKDMIGSGIHERFLISKNKFMDKVNSKSSN